MLTFKGKKLHIYAGLWMQLNIKISGKQRMTQMIIFTLKQLIK